MNHLSSQELAFREAECCKYPTCTVCIIKTNHKKILFITTNRSNTKKRADEMGS